MAGRDRLARRRSEWSIDPPHQKELGHGAAAHGPDRLAEPDQVGSDEAQDTLHRALPLLEEAASDRIVGMIGGAQVFDAVNQDGVDEIIISTESPRVPRWLRMDVPKRLEVLGKPITTVSVKAEPEPEPVRA